MTPLRATSLCLRSAAALAVITVTLAACRRGDGEGGAADDDPVRSLDARVESTRYAHDFWLDQARRKTAVWDSAYRVCSAYWPRQDGSRPNCGHVYTANFAHAGERAPVRKRDMSVPSQMP